MLISTICRHTDLSLHEIFCSLTAPSAYVKPEKQHYIGCLCVCVCVCASTLTMPIHFFRKPQILKLFLANMGAGRVVLWNQLNKETLARQGTHYHETMTNKTPEFTRGHTGGPGHPPPLPHPIL